jgi:hypothetical protein
MSERQCWQLRQHRVTDGKKSLKTHFYLPYMEYEGSIGLVTGKIKKKFAYFHFLELYD